MAVNVGSKNPGKHFSYSNPEQEVALDSRTYGAYATTEGTKTILHKIGFRAPGGKGHCFNIVALSDNPKQTATYIKNRSNTCGTLKQCLANTALNICGLLADEYSDVVNATFKYSEETPVWED